MSERKVLNKYFPPDYDPSKIPRLPKQQNKNRVFNIRTMAPCNMRCNSCRNYIYKGRKFNSRMEVADGETYLGLRIYRFYIRCPYCVSEITWKTDLENQDYTLEHGATRNFEALRTAERQAAKKQEEYEAELEADPMRMLEVRTEQSKNEMDRLEALGDLKELNKRQAGFEMNECALAKLAQLREQQKMVDEFQDEEFVRSVFKKGEQSASSSASATLHLLDSDEDEEKNKDLECGTNTSVFGNSIPHAAVGIKRKINEECGVVKREKTRTSLRSQLKGAVVKKKVSQQALTCTEVKIQRCELQSAVVSDIPAVPVLGGGLLGLNYSDSDDSQETESSISVL